MKASFASALLLALTACSGNEVAPCSDAWMQQVEAQVITRDANNHGPDIGSAEWRSTVEFKLGLRGASDLPESGSMAWCRYIGEQIAHRKQAG